MLAKKTSKNQVTLPREIVKEFPDVDYFDVSVEKGNVLMKPVRLVSVSSSVQGLREKIRKLGIKEEDINDAVSWARKRKTP